eukprot:CAMPEP_0171096456 /NCGR_PEP_ID=MMETSP0766_2-20121228/44777_1 /TAXON_ID=439317 /ORGANISM="Gambierdiscus australes, Strain CAWD 149" /LENGTH=149 /DNA_ID=CAMNT_0011555439 /DNA_START=45 /DNA_END=494 /DNA_ORIENTATION=+
MARVRAGTRTLLLMALAATALNTWCPPAAFAPLRAAAAGMMLLVSDVSVANMAQAPSYDNAGSSVQLAAMEINMGGQAEGGGLDGIVELKGKVSKKDFIDDEDALKAEEKFEAKFDSYVYVFGILFVGAFIAPMVTYFWYVRDSDPWEN